MLFLLHCIRWLVCSTISLSLQFLTSVQALLAWMWRASCTLVAERLVNLLRNERLISTKLKESVARVRFQTSAICGLSLLLVLVLASRVFLRILRFSSLHKIQHSKFDQDRAGTRIKPAKLGLQRNLGQA